jgi:hypothetical protein
MLNFRKPPSGGGCKGGLRKTGETEAEGRELGPLFSTLEEGCKTEFSQTSVEEDV